MMKKGKPLPFALAGQTIYYAGPCPAPAGKRAASCGPTTSYRVDVFTPALLDAGLKGMIGKGERGEAVVKSIVRNRAVYFAAIGGLGATYGNAIRKSECIAFPDLLSEGVHRLEMRGLPRRRRHRRGQRQHLRQTDMKREEKEKKRKKGKEYSATKIKLYSVLRSGFFYTLIAFFATFAAAAASTVVNAVELAGATRADGIKEIADLLLSAATAIITGYGAVRSGSSALPRIFQPPADSSEHLEAGSRRERDEKTHQDV